MSRQSIIDKIRRSYSGETVEFSPDEHEVKERYFKIFTIKCENPTYTDKQVHKILTDDLDYDVSYKQTWRDIALIEPLLGSIKKASKDWIRYFIVESCKEAIQLAKDDPEASGPSKAKSIALANNVIGKYCQLDKDDPELFDPDEIYPQAFEPTTDPSVIHPNFKALKNRNQVVEKLKKKYKVEEELIVDAHILEDE